MAKGSKASSTKVLLNSVSALTKDMKSMDSRVDHLAASLGSRRSRRQGAKQQP